MGGRHFVSLANSSREELLDTVIKSLERVAFHSRGELPPVLARAQKTRLRNGFRHPLVFTLMLQPSTRTKGSFAAASRLNGYDYHAWDVSSSSLAKGESLLSTVQQLILQGADIIVVRSPWDGTAALMADAVSSGESWAVDKRVAIIDAGSGRSSHPTQVLVDLTALCARTLGVTHINAESAELLSRLVKKRTRESLRAEFGEMLDRMTIAFVGDYAHARHVTEWCRLASYFKLRYIFVAPRQLWLGDADLPPLTISQSESLNSALQSDLTYTVRLRAANGGDEPATATVEQMAPFVLGEDFLRSYRGLVTDGLPISKFCPMLPESLCFEPRYSSQVIAVFVSGFGVPVRSVVLENVLTQDDEPFPSRGARMLRPSTPRHRETCITLFEPLAYQLVRDEKNQNESHESTEARCPYCEKQ